MVTALGCRFYDNLISETVLKHRPRLNFPNTSLVIIIYVFVDTISANQRGRANNLGVFESRKKLEFLRSYGIRKNSRRPINSDRISFEYV